MGYLGLSAVTDSDMAADLACEATEAMIRVLKKGFKEGAGNCYNTEGPVNVGLILEELVDANFYGRASLAEYAIFDFIPKFEKYIAKEEKELKKAIKNNEVDDVDNANWHIKSYKRILKNVQKFEDFF